MTKLILATIALSLANCSGPAGVNPQEKDSNSSPPISTGCSAKQFEQVSPSQYVWKNLCVPDDQTFTFPKGSEHIVYGAKVLGTMVVPKGTKILFAASTQLQVKGGNLVTEGSPESPVTLRSVDPDTPWDGIVLTDRASAFLEQTHLETGGVVLNRSTARLENVQIRQGRTCLKIDARCKTPHAAIVIAAGSTFDINGQLTITDYDGEAIYVDQAESTPEKDKNQINLSGKIHTDEPEENAIISADPDKQRYVHGYARIPGSIFQSYRVITHIKPLIGEWESDCTKLTKKTWKRSQLRLDASHKTKRYEGDRLTDYWYQGPLVFVDTNIFYTDDKCKNVQQTKRNSGHFFLYLTGNGSEKLTDMIDFQIKSQQWSFQHAENLNLIGLCDYKDWQTGVLKEVRGTKCAKKGRDAYRVNIFSIEDKQLIFGPWEDKRPDDQKDIRPTQLDRQFIYTKVEKEEAP